MQWPCHEGRTSPAGRADCVLPGGSPGAEREVRPPGRRPNWTVGGIYGRLGSERAGPGCQLHRRRGRAPQRPPARTSRSAPPSERSSCFRTKVFCMLGSCPTRTVPHLRRSACARTRGFPSPGSEPSIIATQPSLYGPPTLTARRPRSGIVVKSCSVFRATKLSKCLGGARNLRDPPSDQGTGSSGSSGWTEGGKTSALGLERVGRPRPEGVEDRALEDLRAD